MSLKAKVFIDVSFRRTLPFQMTRVVLETPRKTCSFPSYTLVWEKNASVFAQICLIAPKSTTYLLTFFTSLTCETIAIISLG